jgi:hypothetical protein
MKGAVAMIITVPLTPDADGFITQECKNCEKQFKVAFGVHSKDAIAHCPYCNHEGQFWTADQIKYLNDMAAGVTPPPDMPEEKKWPTQPYQFKCKNGHKDRIKHKDNKWKYDLHCIICGC